MLELGWNRNTADTADFQGHEGLEFGRLGILVSTKYSAELLTLHQHAQRANLAAERRGDWHLLFPKIISLWLQRMCHAVTATVYISHSL